MKKDCFQCGARDFNMDHLQNCEARIEKQQKSSYWTIREMLQYDKYERRETKSVPARKED